MVSRAHKTALGEWWWTVDRLLLVAFLILMGAGIVLSLAASPAVANRIGLQSFHFFERHVFFLVPALLVMIGVSFLSPRHVRRICLAIFIAMLAALVAVLFVGTEIKGARRWISFAGIGFQPSEFIKPAFVVLVAWLMAESTKRPEIPGNLFALALLGLVVSLLVMQPDFGQTVLVVGTWAIMFFIASMPWMWVLLIGAAGAGGIAAAYYALPHVAGRINRFISGEGDNFQTDTALEAITRGGWAGRGPGEGTVKRILPDSHTDFIFAVAAEEYGIAVTIVLLAVFAFVVLRGLWHALALDDPFCRIATAGLVSMFGMQTAINLGVNLSLLPAKGMTLPFVSYGGTSMIAVAFGMGLVLALSRRRPRSQALAEVERQRRAPPTAQPSAA